MKNLKLSTKLASAVLGKELVSEVLNIPKEAIVHIYTDGNYLLIRKTNSRVEEYNIYGFAFKCKEFAENKGYIIFSKNKECLIYSIDEVYDVIECLNQYEEYFESDTEIESIVKACNWILEQNK